MEESFISVQAKVSQALIQKTIETQLKSILGQDGLSVDLPQGNLLIENVDNVQYQVSNKDILVAADLEVEYNNEETINVLGEATIQLVIHMTYEVKPDFTLRTETKLQEYKWIEKPSLKIGRLKIPSKGALNLLIKGFDQKLGKQIDTLISEKVDLQKIVTTQLAKFENPIPNNFDKNIHLSIRPDNLLFNIAENGGHYGLTIHTTFGAEVNWEKRAATKIFSELPHIQEFDGRSTPSEVQLPIKVDYALLVDVLGKQFAHVKVMDEDLQLSDLKLGYQRSLLHISANISGSVSGALQAHLVPRLDHVNQRIHLDQLKYEIKSSNFLVKAAVFLFKGKIDQQIDKFSTIELKPIFDKIIRDLNEKLSKISIKGLQFDVKMDKIKITNLAFFESFLKAEVKVIADGQVA